MVYVDPLIGRTLGNYRLDRLLGRGGMARVYFGWDIRLHRPVAIKVMDERYRDNPAYTARFVREARAVAAWNHPNISKVYFAGEEEGWPFFVMEYIRGLDLQQLLRQYTAAGELMPHTDVLRIGRAMAKALDYAHQKGVIHRDVKPSNLIVSDDGRVVLTDFGLAMNVTQGTLGEVFGSPHYIAPEQARNSSEAVPQSDLYSLGVMLFEMLTGVVPFDDPSPTALALKHLTQDPPPPRQLNPALNPQVETVLLKALAKQPGQRYQTGEALVDALQSALELGQERAQPVTLPYVVGSQAETEPGSNGRGRPTLSHIQVTQKINEYLSGQSTARTPGSGAPPTYGGPVNSYPAAPPARPAGMVPRWALGCFIVLLLSALAGGLALGYAYNLQQQGGSSAGLPTQEATVSAAVFTATGTAEEASATLAQESPTPETLAETSTPTETPTPSVTPTQTLTPTPTNTSTETLPPTARPTLNPDAEYQLFFFKFNDDLYIMNLGETDFPLGPLVLKNDRDELSGEEWDLDELEPGQCVVAQRERRGNDRGNPDRSVITINGRECDPIGETVTRSPNNRLWSSTFEIYYEDELIGRCEDENNVCEIFI
jgi:serine/threonine protein kinase